MDGIRVAMRLAVVAVVGLLLAVVVLFSSPTPDSTPAPAMALMTQDGKAPLAVPTAPGMTRAIWEHRLVVVFVEPASRLAAVDELRGKGSATPSVPLPTDDTLRVFAFYATPPRHCPVTFNPALGASKDVADYDGDGVPDGRAIDPCHFAQFDIYDRAAPAPGTPAREALPVLDVFAKDGFLYATGFDGAAPAQPDRVWFP